MEVRGNEFIKNLEIEKEKVKLKEESDLLNAQKQQAVFNSSNENINDSSDFQELDDIVLDNNNNNKQKYIIFGLSLVLLFLITIVIIRLIQEPKDNNSFETDDTIEKVDSELEKTTTKKINQSLDIDKIVQVEETIKAKPQPIAKAKKIDSDGDLFGIEKKEQTKKIEDVELEKKDKIIKNITKTKSKNKPKHQNIIIKNPIKEINLNQKLKQKTKKTLLKPKGWYIQVGAFTTSPNKRLLKALKNTKYNFI